MMTAAKRYTMRMVIFAIAYTAAIFGINVIDNAFDLPAPARIILSLIPVAPAVFCIFAIVSFVRDMDEVQSRIITESVMIAAITVSIASFTYGMMRGAVELPVIEAYWYLPALIAATGASQPFVSRRYR